MQILSWGTVATDDPSDASHPEAAGPQQAANSCKDAPDRMSLSLGLCVAGGTPRFVGGRRKALQGALTGKGPHPFLAPPPGQA